MRGTIAIGALTLAAALGSAPALAAEGWAASGGVVRAGPAFDYPDIAPVAGGEHIHIFGCLRDYDWCDIAASGERGWIPASKIVVERGGSRVALPGVAAILGLGVLAFDHDRYWDDHYRGRAFFSDRNAPHPGILPRAGRVDMPGQEATPGHMDSHSGPVRRGEAMQPTPQPRPGASAAPVIVQQPHQTVQVPRASPGGSFGGPKAGSDHLPGREQERGARHD